MDEVLGLIGLAGYILAVVGLAAAVTYVVIRIFPTERGPKKDDSTGEDDKPDKQRSTSGDAPQGSLFRRSKREKGS